MPITIARNQLFPASCFAIIFTSFTFAFGAAAEFYAEANSFLKVAIILAILLMVFTVIYPWKNFYNRHEASKPAIYRRRALKQHLSILLTKINN